VHGSDARRTGATLLASAAVAGVLSVAYVHHALGSIEDWTTNKRFAIRGAHAPTDVAIVAIDDSSIAQLGPWPFPRRDHATVIRKVADDRPRAIAVDIQFTEPTDRQDDSALVSAVAYADQLAGPPTGSGKVVLGTLEADNAGDTNVFGGGGILGRIGARAGFVGFKPDRGGVLRRVPWGSGTTLNGKPATPLESLSLVAAELATGRPIPRSTTGSSTTIAYVGPPGTVPTYSYADVLRGRVAPTAFRGKVVVIGPTAAALNDLHVTPYGAGRPMAGAEIQANAVETALHGFPLRSSRTRDLLLIVVFSFLAPVASLFLAWRWCLVLVAAAAVLYLVAAQVSFDHGVLLAVTWPLLALALGTIAAGFLRPRGGRVSPTRPLAS
jgi:CHASE2 domain-containing sensor protein